MKSKVYFARVKDGAAPVEQAEAAARALAATGFEKRLGPSDLVAVKLHVGELHNATYLRPELVAAAVAAIKRAQAEPFLTDTSTLYKGQRENAVRHAAHASAHGFTVAAVGAPFVGLDGLAGTHEREVRVDGEINQTVKIAGELFLADGLLVIAHVTGHMEAGLGAAIKSVGMGLASRAGKMRQHSTITPEIDPSKCQNCGKCRQWCPEDAIGEREGQTFIVREKCVGCGQCIAVCRFGAVKYDYKIESRVLQKSMAEHAAGAIRHFGPKAAFINVAIDMTQDCDCWDRLQKKFAPDLGVLASNDIVALELATLELTAAATGKNVSQLAYPNVNPLVQIEHAEKMGLGKRDHEIVEV